MVKMVVKNSGGGKEEFLYEAACSMKVDDLVDELVKIWNLRKKVVWLMCLWWCVNG